ncbi:MAG: hypothetical protein ACRDMV_00045 [Streptosporangiales bacterium]
MLRKWFKEHRRFLAAAPVALVLGFAWPGWQAWHGNDQSASEPIDVAAGEAGHYAGADFKLKRLQVEQPKSQSTEQSAPEDAVVVVATFRGRMPDKKTEKDLFCYFHVQNSDGWQWGSDSASVHDYVSEDTSDQCNGQTLNDKFEDVYPKPGKWFDFAVAFTVPESRAVGLRPTLEYHEEYPYYLRFEH